MRNEIAAGLETLPPSFKMHSSMCMKLRNLVVRIMKIFPDIEEARPGYSSGIESLCVLNNALNKSKLLLQYCSESSKLYMAVTGDAILSRSLRAKILLEQSLSEIQKMTPVVLAVKISEIIHDLKSAMFTLDASEEEAGKAVAEMMQRRVSSSICLNDIIREFHLAAWKLQLSTLEAIVIERRSLEELIRRLGEDNLDNRKILNSLLYLLQKYEQFIDGYKKEESSLVLCFNKDHVSINAAQMECSEERKHDDHESFLLGNATPPKEFICPLSLRVMYDPVFISSGQTFERMWIQKWFDEGNDSCPKTKTKLEHLLLHPNTRLKDLILHWLSKHIEDPRKQSETLHCMVLSGKTWPVTTIDDDNGSSQTSTIHSEAEIEPLFGLTDLPWETQRIVVKDVRSRFEHDSQAFQSLFPQKFLDPLVTYLKNANDKHSVEDIRAGLDLLLVYLTKNRKAVESLNEDVCRLLSIFLDLEVAGEALNIVEMLSGHPHGLSEITSWVNLSSLLKIFESQSSDLQKQAIITLQNLSSSKEICLEMVSLRFTQKLTSLLQQNMLKKYSLVILKNLCNTEKGCTSVATTENCLASVAKLLESESPEDQDNTVTILLKLCMQPKYCYLMMEEDIGVIPSLVFISNNGCDKAKVRAMELLRILQGVDFGKEPRSSTPEETSIQYVSPKSPPSHKKFRLFGLKLSVPILKKKR